MVIYSRAYLGELVDRSYYVGNGEYLGFSDDPQYYHISKRDVSSAVICAETRIFTFDENLCMRVHLLKELSHEAIANCIPGITADATACIIAYVVDGIILEECMELITREIIQTIWQEASRALCERADLYERERAIDSIFDLFYPWLSEDDFEALLDVFLRCKIEQRLNLLAYMIQFPIIIMYDESIFDTLSDNDRLVCERIKSEYTILFGWSA